MMRNSKSSGYILLLTLMIVSLSLVVITYLTDLSSSFTPFIRIASDREKAVALALGGIEVARAQLAGTYKKEEKKQPSPLALPGMSQQQNNQDDVQLLKTLLPNYTQWQTFALEKERDGMRAELKIAITCEQGKFNINELYDFKKHTFNDAGKKPGETKKVLQQLFARMTSFVGGADLFGVFEKFLKERQYKLQDVTELLTIKEFQVFQDAVFYDPSDSLTDQSKKEKRPLFLTDIFTIWSDSAFIEPWLLSESVVTLLDLKRDTQRYKKDKEVVAQLLTSFTPQTVWATAWDKQLQPLYGKSFASLPEGLASFLSTTFKPTKFCVVSYAKVGKIVQKILAIVERAPGPQDGLHDVKIRKLYWL